MEDSRKEILFLFPEFYKTNKGVNNFKTILGNFFKLYERTIEEDNDFQNDYSHLESNLDDFKPKIYNFVLYLYVPRKSDNQILNTMMIKAKNKFKCDIIVILWLQTQNSKENIKYLLEEIPKGIEKFYFFDLGEDEDLTKKKLKEIAEIIIRNNAESKS